MPLKLEQSGVLTRYAGVASGKTLHRSGAGSHVPNWQMISQQPAREQQRLLCNMSQQIGIVVNVCSSAGATPQRLCSVSAAV